MNPFCACGNCKLTERQQEAMDKMIEEFTEENSELLDDLAEIPCTINCRGCSCHLGMAPCNHCEEGHGMRRD